MGDFFIKKASTYDKDSKRVANVDAIVDSMLKNISFNKNMHLIDFGAGTGLLLEGIAPYVAQITAVDVSDAMIGELSKKQQVLLNEHDCTLNIVKADLTQPIDADLGFNALFDGIISSMTLHHIKDIPAIFSRLKQLIKPNGFIAIADLDTEAGDFHTEDTGVHHFGFERDYLNEVALATGFKDTQIHTANEFKKNGVGYSVFLFVAHI
ncbi:class I SAM-dependent methyltransferase [Psychrobacter sp. HD31]|uniref:class I SAM-dependent DNA methyltransferase n=1 Tax=Psychrobacter sp. HD31 TaxID=3112003 RepID=UPI003DA53F1E